MEISIWWIRRDLRLDDNLALYNALRSGHPVLPVFLFDADITDGLEPDDRRLVFLWQMVLKLKADLESAGSTLLIGVGRPIGFFSHLFNSYRISAVYASVDYEPYSLSRDGLISGFCREKGAGFFSFHDHVVFHPGSVVKADGKPYHVFTPYSRAWLTLFGAEQPKVYPSADQAGNLIKSKPASLPDIKALVSGNVSFDFPPALPDENKIGQYHLTRDFPAVDGTSRLGVHLRFGTISIRKLALLAARINPVFLNELIWREFYQMILYHYPAIVTRSFKPGYDRLAWRSSEEDFDAWCRGRTGYPLVDAGMRELTATGYMHNRIRMVTASFLTKHLLIDWRMGEAFFARHLLDYELASNNGGWQWAAGSGCDAAPYFRVFNPQLQQVKFDPRNEYVRKWVPEYNPGGYPIKPIVDHAFARQRAISFLSGANRG